MKKVLLVASFLLAGLATVKADAKWKVIQSETGNHCTDQFRGHMRYLFGEKVEFDKPYSEVCHTSDTRCKSWFKTNLCNGAFVAETIKGAGCNVAHYGFVPMYVARIWAYGDCRKVLKRDVYPRNDNTEPYIRRPKN